MMKNTESSPNSCLKKELRKEAKRCRDAIPFEKQKLASEKMSERLFSLTEWQQAERIFLYLSFGSEADTGRIREQAEVDGKRIYAPRMQGEEILFYPADKGNLQMHPYGILEPSVQGEPVLAGRNDLILVPGLLFSGDGFRLGYGGGFYDRFLKKCPDATSIGLCYETQLYDDIPREPWDQSLDIVLTEIRRIEHV